MSRVDRHTAFRVRRPHGGEPTVCDILHIVDGSYHIVVFVQRDDNPGLSVTHGSEYLATAFYPVAKGTDCLLFPNGVMWAEWYPKLPRGNMPNLDHIEYTWNLRDGVWTASHPRWSILPNEVSDRILNMPPADTEDVDISDLIVDAMMEED